MQMQVNERVVCHHFQHKRQKKSLAHLPPAWNFDRNEECLGRIEPFHARVLRASDTRGKLQRSAKGTAPRPRHTLANERTLAALSGGVSFQYRSASSGSTNSR
jgi:hypothetical protein